MKSAVASLILALAGTAGSLFLSLGMGLKRPLEMCRPVFRGE